MNAKLQKIHNARTLRALSNLKELFKLRLKYGTLFTEKEKQMLKDLNPGVHKISEESAT